MNEHALKRRYGFDLYGRYALIRDIINLNRDSNQRYRVLDVGGAGNILREFLRFDDVCYLDLKGNKDDENFIEADGCNMPLEDNSFDWVASADVFEHVPPTGRIRFLDENLRVAKIGVILAAPFDTEGVSRAEISVNEAYKSFSGGKNHEFLAEHIKHGLPSEKILENYLEKRKLKYQKLGNNHLPFWEILLSANLVLSVNFNQKIKDKLHDFNYFYNDGVFPSDSVEPTYRKIFFIKKKDDLKDIAGCFSNSPPAGVIPGAMKLLAEVSRGLREEAAGLEKMLGASREQATELNERLRVSEEQATELNERLRASEEQAAELNERLRASEEQADELGRKLEIAIYGKDTFRTYILRISPLCSRIKVLGKFLKYFLSAKWFRGACLLSAYIYISKSGLFDPVYYIEQYKDVFESGVDPLLHYLLEGYHEGRNPNPEFDSSFYLESNGILHGINPLLHYIRFGRAAGYRTRPTPSENKFDNVNANPPVVLLGEKQYMKGVSIVIPCLNGGEVFKSTLKAIRNQDFKGRKEVIIVDSGSNDGTCEVAREYGCVVENLPRHKFQHGLTRNYALSLAKYECVIYMVQDAIPFNAKWLGKVYNSLDRGVLAAYGRQMPMNDADLFGRFETEQHNKYLGDCPRIQSKDNVCECSPYEDMLYNCRLDNVCAIYWHEALDKIPLPEVIYGEDMSWAKQVIDLGFNIRYDPEIMVFHSHKRNPEYRLRRTVIDTIICASILNILKTDYRPAGLQELFDLETLCEETLVATKMRFKSQTSPKIISFRKKIQASRGETRKDPITPFTRIAADFKAHVNTLLEIIATWYPDVSEEEYLQCVPQACAVSRGLIIGQVYSAYMLNKQLSTELYEYVKPMKEGV